MRCIFALVGSRTLTWPSALQGIASWIKTMVGGGSSSAGGSSSRDNSRPANKLATILGFPDPATLVRDLNSTNPLAPPSFLDLLPLAFPLSVAAQLTPH